MFKVHSTKNPTIFLLWIVQLFSSVCTLGLGCHIVYIGNRQNLTVALDVTRTENNHSDCVTVFKIVQCKEVLAVTG